MQYPDGEDDKSADDIFPPKPIEFYRSINYNKFLESLVVLYYISSQRDSNDPLRKFEPETEKELLFHSERLKLYADQN